MRKEPTGKFSPEAALPEGVSIAPVADPELTSRRAAAPVPSTRPPFPANDGVPNR
jgi:hypothetical protein